MSETIETRPASSIDQGLIDRAREALRNANERHADAEQNAVHARHAFDEATASYDEAVQHVAGGGDTDIEPALAALETARRKHTISQDLLVATKAARSAAIVGETQAQADARLPVMRLAVNARVQAAERYQNAVAAAFLAVQDYDEAGSAIRQAAASGIDISDMVNEMERRPCGIHGHHRIPEQFDRPPHTPEAERARWAQFTQ